MHAPDAICRAKPTLHEPERRALLGPSAGGRTPRVIAAVLCGAVLVAGASCARRGGDGARAASAAPVSSQARAAGADAPPLAQALSADFPEGQYGLGVLLFQSDADQHTLATALAPYLDEPLPLTGEGGADAAEAWRVAGMRLVSVPSEKLAWVLSQLAITGAGERQWLGAAPRWTMLTQSPPRAAHVLALEGERLDLPAGQMRLLGRAWIVPEASESLSDRQPRAALHVELLPQHRDFRTRNPLGVAEVTTSPGEEGASVRLEAREPSPLDEGLNFERLRAVGRMTARRVLVIVSESPSADWREQARSPSPREEGEAESPERPSNQDGAPGVGEVSRSSPANTRARVDGMESSGPEAARVEGFGPRAVEVPTIGRDLLVPAPFEPVAAPLEKPGEATPAARSPGSARPPKRTIVVLVAQVPERFTLLP